MTNKSEKSKFLLKIAIIGSGFKLKEKLVRSYAGGDTMQSAPTLGIDMTTKDITVNNRPIRLILVNTAGQEFFGKLRPNYYRGVSACAIVFDKSDRKSFDTVPDWLKEFQSNIPVPDIPIALVGINTKEEDVSTDEGKALTELLDLPYFETSSPTFENVHEIFVYLCEKVIK